MGRRSRISARLAVRGPLLAAILGGAGLSGCAAGSPGVARDAARAPAIAADDALLRGDTWRDQGLNDVLPYWTRHARDRDHGAFFAHLDREWRIDGPTNKYPGMVSRHLFSYSAAYLLSGEEEHLQVAREIFEFLTEHGWDPEYGGWYDVVDRSGRVVEDSKDLFNQAYAVTGLAMYWFVTHDERARSLMDRSLEILREHAWDAEHGGYIRSLNRDLTVREFRKDFSPQIAHLSGYLVYLWAGTRDPAYLRQYEKVLRIVMDRTRDPETGWVMGRFERDWSLAAPRDEVRVNVGHNLETAWLLLRLHLATGREALRDEGLRLADSMREHGFRPDPGVWVHQIALADGSVPRSTTPWWIQAYGNMIALYQYRVTGEARHLDAFRKGAEFWNRAFMDPVHGATFLSAHLDGTLDNGAKAVRTKTSYHAMEYALLLYLYLRLWVEEEPVTLHFRVEDPRPGTRLYPSPIEDGQVRIHSVDINGRPWAEFDVRRGFIELPGGGTARVRVVLAPQ